MVFNASLLDCLENWENIKKENTKWDPDYLHNIQGWWQNKSEIEIDFNRYPITYSRNYFILIFVLLHIVYKYWHENKSKLQPIWNGLGRKNTFMNSADINFLGDMMVRLD